MTGSKEPTGSSSDYFAFFEASREKADMFGKHFTVFSLCTRFLVCASQ